MNEEKKKPARKTPAKKKPPAKKAQPKKEEPEQIPEIILEAQPAEPQLSTYEKRARERARKNRLVIVASVFILVVIAGGLTAYAVLRPKPEIASTKTPTATSTVSKPTFKGALAGHIYITRLGIDEPLYLSPSGTVTQDDLLKGATFFNGETSKAGAGNCVIFGHSAVTSEHGAPFGAIGDGLAKVNDKIVLTDANNNKYNYVVDKIYEISATDFSVVQPLPESETPVLTIITCVAPNYPKDTRLVVHAVLQK